jgi:hypothetical protein
VLQKVLFFCLGVASVSLATGSIRQGKKVENIDMKLRKGFGKERIVGKLLQSVF